MLFATRFTEKWRLSDGVRESVKLVVVDADTAEHAAVISGLVHETFWPATQTDTEEWEDLCDQPLTVHERTAAMKLARKEARRAGRSSQRRGLLGDGAFDMDRARAALLNVVAEKMTRMGGEGEGY